MAITREDLIKNNKFLETLTAYGLRRNGDVYESKEEAVDGFLEDYRAVQANTISTAKFMNFVNNIDDNNKQDAEFKKNLGELYKVVDEEVDEVFGDTTAGEKLDAVWDYAKYAIIDPINLLGGVAGKAIGATVGRAAVKGLVNNTFKSRVGNAAVKVGAVEAGIGTGQEALLQETEKDLGVRKEIDLGEVATAGAIGGVTGGVFGAVGAKLSGGDKVANIKKIAEENLEDTVQGRGAKRTSLDEAFTNFDDDLITSKVDVTKEATVDEFNGSYIFAKGDVEIDEKYFPLGKITSVDKDGRTAQVEFLPKGDDEAGSIIETLDFKDIKLASESQTNNSVNEYTSKYSKFYDKSDPDFEKAKTALKDGGLFTDSELDETFGVMINPEATKSINDAILGVLKENPTMQKVKINRMKRVTENFSQLIDMIDGDPTTAAGRVIDSFAKKNIPIEQIQTYYKADISIAMTKGGNQSVIQQLKDSNFLQVLQDAADKVTPEQRGLLKIIADEKEAEKKLASRFGVAVDVWRSFLVTQPATTMRNIIGSAARIPGQTAEAQLDNLLIKIDSNILGFDESLTTEVLSRNILDLSKNMFSPEDSIPLVRMISKSLPEVDKKIFQQFDDHIKIDVEAGENLWDKTVSGINKASQFANLLNRHQDRAVKSASFLSELDWLIKQDINRGRITEAGIDGIDSMLKTNKLNLLNDEMVSKALEFAYKMTYQTKRAGDDLYFGGSLINNFQSFLNSSAIIKTVIPFPNFLINSLVFTTNRVGLGAVKLGFSGADVIKRSLDKAGNRSKRIDLESKTKQLEGMASSKDPVNQTKMKQLLTEIDDLDRYFGKAQKSLINLKRGVTETIEGGALLSMALALREYSGGSEWYLIKDASGQERDMRPLFPFAPFLFFADLILRANKDMPISEDYVKNGAEAVLGVSARSGAIGNLMRNGYTRLQTMDNDPLAAKDLGKSLGSIFGYMVGGFTTPLRPITDLSQTLGGPENLERSMQQNAFGLDIELEWPVLQGFIDQAAKDIFRGTPFERGVVLPGGEGEKIGGAFKDTPKYVSGSSSETPDAPLAPIEKQLTGATVAPKKTIVGEQLAKLGIPEYKTVAYTSVKEYNYVYKKMLGIAATKLIEPYLRSSEYLNATPTEQRKNLYNMYFGKSSDNLPGRVKKAFKFSNVGKVYNNVRQLVNDQIKEKMPVLYSLTSFRRANSSKNISEAIEIYKNRVSQVGPLSLKYVDENKDKAGAKKLKEKIDALKKIIKEENSMTATQMEGLQTIARRQNILPKLSRNNNNKEDLKFNEGGYVSQMDELGF